MNKTIITLVIALVTVNLFSQSKEFTFQTEGKRSILGFEIAKSGDIFIETGNNVISGKGQKRKIFKYNSNLEKIFAVDIKPSKRSFDNPYDSDITYIGMNASDNGNYLFEGNWIVDEKGGIKNYVFKKNRSGTVNDIFSFFSNNYHAYIGPKKGRKNKKKKYSDGDIYIFSRKNSDLTTTENALEMPQLMHVNLKEGKAISWFPVENFDNYFTLVAKNDINKERTIDTYHVASYNYNGKLIAYTPLTVELDKKAHFILSDNGGPTEFLDHNYGAFASGNIHTDTKTGDMYVYGFYTDRAKKKMIMGQYKGFYLVKFDSKGSFLWKKQVPIKNNKFFGKTLMATQANIYFDKINDDSFMIRANHSQKGGINTYIFDTAKGDLVATKIGHIEKNKMAYRRAYVNKKSYPKKYFSYDAATAINLKQSIKNYVSKLDAKKKIYLDAKILENGVIILTQYEIKKSNAIKFNKTKILRYE